MPKDDDYTGCGISRIWATDKSDPLFPACEAHDYLYSDEGQNVKLTRKEADQILLYKGLFIAKDNIKLRFRAYLYYAIARALGWLYWEK